MVEYWGSKDTQIKGQPAEQHADDKGRGSIIITNDNRHIYPERPKDQGEKPNWIEKGNLFVLALTFGAAIFAGFEAMRLANLTETAVSDSKKANDEQTRVANATMVAANRAWVGPLHATILPPVKDQPLTITVQYVNTGREPALNVVAAHTGKAYSAQEWDNGTAAKEIETNAESCLQIVPVSDVQVVYPTASGSFYSSTFKTDQASLKYIATDDLIAGKDIFATQGCFSYLSISKPRHSAFCYYYQAGSGQPPSMSICNIGNKAD